MQTSAQEEKIEISLLVVPSESRVGSSHDEETSNEPGKLQLLFPSSSYWRKSLPHLLLFFILQLLLPSKVY